MDQKKNGRFISEMRKKYNLTQKQLAEKLGVSDKTISKWECGNSFPDVDMLMPLCSELQISVNELLSGEELSANEYLERAEENMMDLIEKSNNEKRSFVKTLVLAGAWMFSAIVIVIGMLMAINLQITDVAFYLDLYSLLAVLCISGFALGFSGKIKAFFCAFRIKATDTEKAVEALQAVKIATKLFVLSGVFVSLFQCIGICYQLDQLKFLGPNLAVALISALYGIFLAILLMPVRVRLEKAVNGLQ